MTPVQGAAYLGVPNLYFIHFPKQSAHLPVSGSTHWTSPHEAVVWSLTGLV